MKSETVSMPAYYGALNKVAEGLGTEGEGAAAKQEAARKQLLLFSVPQIVAYLDARYSIEEAKRQKIFRRIYHNSAFLVSCAIAVWIFYDPLYKISPKLPNLITMVPSLWLVLGSFLDPRLDFSPIRLQGMAIMLSEYAEVEQVPELIEAMTLKESRAAVKERLALMLPRYHRADRPRLSTQQTAILTRYLKASVSNILRDKEKAIVEAEIAFVAASMVYFERELSHGNLVPKAVLPLLRRFAIAPASSTIPSAQWTMLQAAAEECLARVGAQK